MRGGQDYNYQLDNSNEIESINWNKCDNSDLSNKGSRITVA